MTTGLGASRSKVNWKRRTICLTAFRRVFDTTMSYERRFACLLERHTSDDSFRAGHVAPAI